jgi:hypothetical protein
MGKGLTAVASSVVIGFVVGWLVDLPDSPAPEPLPPVTSPTAEELSIEFDKYVPSFDLDEQLLATLPREPKPWEPAFPAVGPPGGAAWLEDAEREVGPSTHRRGSWPECQLDGAIRGRRPRPR